MNLNKFEFHPWPVHIGLMCPLASEKNKVCPFSVSVFQITLKVGG